MASAWGYSWAQSWGSSWGVLGVTLPARRVLMLERPDMNISLESPDTLVTFTTNDLCCILSSPTPIVEFASCCE